MEFGILKEQLKKTEMPPEMKKRIISNCKNQLRTENMLMTENKPRSFFKKPVAAAAALAVFLCLTGVTALASAGKLQGFFKDITNWNGAIVGTSYEQATEEIEIQTTLNDNLLHVTIQFLLPEEAPYFTFETFGIEHYEIRDNSGAVVKEGQIAMTDIANAAKSFEIAADELVSGTYALCIDKFVGGSKADQPLVIHGYWESEFTK